MLIVEDGTGKADAESYASVTDLTDYASKVGFGGLAIGIEANEQALRRSTRWLDSRYGKSFKGEWRNDTQALEWPRVGVCYRNSVLASNAVPLKIVEATCEAAFREILEPGALMQDQSALRIKRDRVGDVETEFAAISPGSRASFPVIDGLLAGLVGGMASGYVGRVIRA